MLTDRFEDLLQNIKHSKLTLTKCQSCTETSRHIRYLFLESFHFLFFLFCVTLPAIHSLRATVLTSGWVTKLDSLTKKLKCSSQPVWSRMQGLSVLITQIEVRISLKHLGMFISLCLLKGNCPLRQWELLQGFLWNDNWWRYPSVFCFQVLILSLVYLWKQVFCFSVFFVLFVF